MTHNVFGFGQVGIYITSDHDVVTPCFLQNPLRPGVAEQRIAKSPDP